MKKKLFTAGILMMTAIALVAATVFVTVAYLTSSAAVTNTFTVGNVGIKMYESLVDGNGKKIDDDDDINGDMKDASGNNYHLVPGKTYDKDPTIYVDEKSDESFLFVKIRNTIRTIEWNIVHPAGDAKHDATNKPTIRQQMEKKGWVYLKEGAGNTGTIYYYAGQAGITYNGLTADQKQTTTLPVPEKVNAKDAEGNQTKIDVFDTFTIADVTGDLAVYGGAKVNVTGFAIQDETFTTANQAWDAIESIYPYEGDKTDAPGTGEPTT